MALSETENARRLFMILSPRSLPYARVGLKSLLMNALERVHLHLITDSQADKQQLVDEIAGYSFASRHSCEVFSKADLDDQASLVFGRYPNICLFRDGHPCWRKITDPLLLSTEREEMVVLDPDLYFPNKFCFEATLNQGLLLMWQKPNCLLPAEIVGTAIARRIALAHHVDIGVAHWRGPIDLDWLESLLGQLGVKDHPNARFSMHIEAIVWAAIAMEVGGGYLPPEHWHCWRRSQSLRLLRKLRVPGPRLLRHERFSAMKCFHAGGEAKHWLEEATSTLPSAYENVMNRPGTIQPFVELTRSTYRREQAMKSWLRRFGYYTLFSNGALQ